MTAKKYRADIILIAGLVIAGVIIGLILLFSNHNGKSVEVRVSGEIVKTFPLNGVTEYEIEGAGGGKNLLIIKEGSAWVEDADCPDKLCVNMGKINLTGQSVICLPHEVVIAITDGESAGADVDVIAE